MCRSSRVQHVSPCSNAWVLWCLGQSRLVIARHLHAPPRGHRAGRVEDVEDEVLQEGVRAGSEQAPASVPRGGRGAHLWPGDPARVPSSGVPGGVRGDLGGGLDGHGDPAPVSEARVVGLRAPLRPYRTARRRVIRGGSSKAPDTLRLMVPGHCW